MARGHMIADAVTIIGTQDIVFGESRSLRTYSSAARAVSIAREARVKQRNAGSVAT